MPATTNPVRIIDGPITFIFTFTRDLDHQIVIDKIFRFDDLEHAAFGKTVRWADLPDFIRLRYWNLVG